MDIMKEKRLLNIINLKMGKLRDEHNNRRKRKLKRDEEQGEEK